MDKLSPGKQFSLSRSTKDDGNLRIAALGAHNRVQDVWGKKASPGANNILEKLEPGRVEAFALDHALRYIWERQRNGNELIQCKLNIEITKKLRNIVVEVLDENLAALTKEYTFEIPDPEIAEQREKEKRNNSLEEVKEREARQEKLKKEKEEREKRIREQRKKEKKEKSPSSKSPKSPKKAHTTKSLKIDTGETKKRKSRSKSPRRRTEATPTDSGIQTTKKEKRKSKDEEQKIKKKDKKKDKETEKEKESSSSLSVPKKSRKSSSSSSTSSNTLTSGRITPKKAFTFQSSDSIEEIPSLIKPTTGPTASIKLPETSSDKSEQSKEEKRLQIQNSRNRRRQFASLPLHGRRPKLLHGGGVETEDPIPIIQIKTFLVDLDEIKKQIETKITQQISDEEINVKNVKVDNKFLDFYHLSLKGPRPANEDEYSVIEHVNELFDIPEDQLQDKYAYFGVFDGHSGKYTSLITRSQLQWNLFTNKSFPDDSSFHDAFVSTDKRANETQRRENFCCGTTALSICVKNNRDLIIGNVGDCRGFLCRAGEPLEIASPHNLNNEEEKDRIKALGGAVVWFGTWRVNGILAVSRSIGDNNLRDLVIPDPDVTRFSITKEDEFLVIASDGLWDGISGNEMIAIVKQVVAEKGREHVCKALCDMGIEKNTKDNVTVVACFFNH